MGCSTVTVIAGTHIHDRISPGIQSACPFKGISQIQRITGGFARFQFHKIDIPIHTGVYNLNKAFLFLCPVIHIHIGFCLLRPFDNQRLTGPPAARPGCISVGKRACISRPDRFQNIFCYIRMTISRIIAEIIAAESKHPFHGSIGISHFKRNFPFRCICTFVCQLHIIHTDSCLRDHIGWLRIIRTIW